ncbi:unnamed protein product, partial [Prunus brigantina]
MEECIVNIKLMQRPVMGSGKSKNTPNKNHLGNRRKCVVVVKTFSLSVSFGHETSLVALNGAIGAMLYFIDPFASNGLLPGRKRSEGPSPIGFQNCNFKLHGLLPVWIRNSLWKSVREWRMGAGSTEGEEGCDGGDAATVLEGKT